jgi:hypothetical protein
MAKSASAESATRQIGDPSLSDQVDALYTDEVVANIANKVRPFVSQQAEFEFPKRIRDWAEGYLLFRELDSDRDSLRTTSIRKELTALARQAGSFVKAIDGLSDDAVRLLAQSKPRVLLGDVPMLGAPNVMDIVGDLGELRAHCQLLNTYATAGGDTLRPKRGPKPDRARRVAVAALAGIFWQSTGQVPTRVIDRITYQPDSRFHSFCVTALTPIHGDQAETGLDKIIRTIWPN